MCHRNMSSGLWWTCGDLLRLRPKPRPRERGKPENTFRLLCTLGVSPPCMAMGWIREGEGAEAEVGCFCKNWGNGLKAWKRALGFRCADYCCSCSGRFSYALSLSLLFFFSFARHVRPITNICSRQPMSCVVSSSFTRGWVFNCWFYFVHVLTSELCKLCSMYHKEVLHAGRKVDGGSALLSGCTSWFVLVLMSNCLKAWKKWSFLLCCVGRPYTALCGGELLSGNIRKKGKMGNTHWEVSRKYVNQAGGE